MFKMKSTNIFFASCLVSFVLTSSLAFSQCQSNVSLTGKTNCSPGQENGQIEIKVNSKGSYEIKLVEYDSRAEKNIEVKSGSGSQSFTFNKLKGDFLYKVLVVFRDEEKFLCKSRVVPNIVLTDEE